MRSGSLDVLRPGAFQVLLGTDLAFSLGVIPGDKVALIAPQGMVTPAGVMPRLKQFTVAGTFQAGIAEADARLALVHMADAQALYRFGQNVSGVRRARRGARSAGEAAAAGERRRLDAQPCCLLPRRGA
jgi:lipoprotein-releasing system permease protein